MSIHSSRSLRTSEILAYHRQTGIRIHHVIGVLCRLDPDVLATPNLAAAAALASAAMRQGPMRRGRDAATQRMAFSTLVFWRELLPRPITRFEHLGTELGFGSIRVDAAYRDRLRGTVFFDEIKTGRWHGQVPATHLAQAQRYAAAGRAYLGQAFVGLRYLNLNDCAGRFWISPSGTWQLYEPSQLLG